MKPTSAGFLIRSNGLYLLCHATQNPDYIYKKDDPFWSIPKGVVDEGETHLEAALRETKEEIGIDLEGFVKIPTEPFNVHPTKKKNFVVYLADDLDGILLNCKFKCSSLINNDRTPQRNGLPEIDMFKWVNKEVARILIQPTLKHIFDLQNA